MTSKIKQKDTVARYASKFRTYTNLTKARKGATAEGTPANIALAQCWGKKLKPEGFMDWKNEKKNKNPWAFAPKDAYQQCRAENKNKDSPSPKRRSKRSPKSRSQSPEKSPEQTGKPYSKNHRPVGRRILDSWDSPIKPTGKKSVLDLLAECYKESTNKNITQAKTNCKALREIATSQANNQELQEWLHLHATTAQLKQLQKSTGSWRRGSTAALAKWKKDWKPATYEEKKRRPAIWPDVDDKKDCVNKLRENENYGYSEYSPKKGKNVYKRYGKKAAEKDCDGLTKKDYELKNGSGEMEDLSASDYEQLPVYKSIRAGEKSSAVQKGQFFRTERGGKVYEKKSATKSIGWNIKKK